MRSAIVSVMWGLKSTHHVMTRHVTSRNIAHHRVVLAASFQCARGISLRQGTSENQALKAQQSGKWWWCHGKKTRSWKAWTSPHGLALVGHPSHSRSGLKLYQRPSPQPSPPPPHPPLPPHTHPTCISKHYFVPLENFCTWAVFSSESQQHEGSYLSCSLFFPRHPLLNNYFLWITVKLHVTSIPSHTVLIKTHDNQCI